MKKMYIQPITETAEVRSNVILSGSGGSTNPVINTGTEPIPDGQGGD